MTIWFLRLFPRFRGLERYRDHCIASEQLLNKQLGEANTRLADSSSDLIFCRARNSELETENIRLNDRLEAATEDRARVWEMLQESLANERKAYQMQVNEEWQRRYGVVPHPDAPHIPETMGHSETGPVDFGRQGRLLPSELVANYERDFWADHAKKAQEREKSKAVPVES